MLTSLWVLCVYQLGDGDSVIELSPSGQVRLSSIVRPDNAKNPESPKNRHHFNPGTKEGV